MLEHTHTEKKESFNSSLITVNFDTTTIIDIVDQN